MVTQRTAALCRSQTGLGGAGAGLEGHPQAIADGAGADQADIATRHSFNACTSSGNPPFLFQKLMSHFIAKQLATAFAPAGAAVASAAVVVAVVVVVLLLLLLLYMRIQTNLVQQYQIKDD